MVILVLDGQPLCRDLLALRLTQDFGGLGVLPVADMDEARGRLAGATVTAALVGPDHGPGSQRIVTSLRACRPGLPMVFVTPPDAARLAGAAAVRTVTTAATGADLSLALQAAMADAAPPAGLAEPDAAFDCCPAVRTTPRQADILDMVEAGWGCCPAPESGGRTGSGVTAPGSPACCRRSRHP